MVLTERLKKEIERKGILPPSQVGFRKGVGIMDNIYYIFIIYLNYLVNRQVQRKGKKTMVLFVDLKTAFDLVNRKVLMKTLREREMREGLVERCEEVLGETINRVRIEEEEGEKFWTEMGVRQGCSLSLLLFILLLSDIDEELKKERWEGVRMGEKKVYILAYADDLALVEDEIEMKDMLEIGEIFRWKGAGGEHRKNKSNEM